VKSSDKFLGAALAAVKILLAGASTLTFVGAAGANAANITWSAPLEETGTAADILTAGSLVGSATAGATTTEGGVTFQGQTGRSGGVITFGAEPITLSVVSVGNASYGAAPGTWDAGYQTLVDQGAYTPTPGQMVLNLSGLTFGKTYDLQIFEAFWNYNWATNFTGGTNTSGNVNLTGGDVGAGPSSTPQYLFGSFIATGSTQSIVLGSPTPYEIFDAVQVRSGAVPEPATWALMLVGFGGSGLALRLRRRMATAQA
jgi:PEP-CTERM motif